MKNLKDIIEGLKVNSKTKINSNDISDLYTIITNYFIKKLNLKTTQYIYRISSKTNNGSSAKDLNDIKEIRVWSKEFKDIDKSANELFNEINKIIKLKELTENDVFSTAIYFYPEN
jgi:hypothetical protein